MTDERRTHAHSGRWMDHVCGPPLPFGPPLFEALLDWSESDRWFSPMGRAFLFHQLGGRDGLALKAWMKGAGQMSESLSASLQERLRTDSGDRSLSRHAGLIARRNHHARARHETLARHLLQSLLP